MNSKTISRLLWLALAMTSGAQAVQVNFQGTLIESVPCTINNGQPITLDFGDVIIRGIDGENYSKPINYEIDCAAPGTVRLSINGTVTQFDEAAVQTDITNLGIRINQSGQPFKLNEPISINQASPPALVAVPVVNPVQQPDPGVFSATATLLAEYQ